MAWQLNGNSNTNPPNDFLGTSDDKPLVIKTHGTEAVRIDVSGKFRSRTSSSAGPLHILGPALDPPAGLPAAQNGLMLGLQSTAGYKWIQSYGGALALNPKGNNVGIGTTTPDAKLHISSDGDFNSPQAEITQTTEWDFARLRFQSFGGSQKFPNLPHSWDIAAANDRLNFFEPNVGNIMTLRAPHQDAGGYVPRVGIGTEDPEATLHVNGTAAVAVLQITGGGDLAEPFLVEEQMEVEPGTVMVIDERHPGKLKISEIPYDTKVAGIVSGAGGLKPGLTLQGDCTSNANTLVAMTGRVYCKAVATSSPIEPGDLLTTSDIPGHAMKALDRRSSHGAIVGKAMTALKEDKGLVLVLVNLQ